jgi:hypothetical protein
MTAGTLAYRLACVVIVTVCAVLLYLFFMQPVAARSGGGICNEGRYPTGAWKCSRRHRRRAVTSGWNAGCDEVGEVGVEPTRRSRGTGS